jgi:excisionase family DNA binding protein
MAAQMDRLALRVAEFAEAMGISRSKGYEVIRANPELAIQIGGSLRVPVDRLREWLAKQQTPSQ